MISIFSIGDESIPNSGVEIINKTKRAKDSAMYKAAQSDHDTNIKIIRVSNIDEMNIPYDIDENPAKIRRVFNGRRINIAVIGIDSRLGTRYKHADANHVISILIDKGVIEITTIPRDTPITDTTFIEDSTQNKLAVLYPACGMKLYLKEVAGIAELNHIHYYIEVGFSQARGLLELFGFKKSGNALQILRSRKVLKGADFQRSYNQAQFIRQMILKHFDKISGFFSGMLIRGALTLVNTNISFQTADNIIEKLKRLGFPHSSNDIQIRVRPPFNMKYRVYDFTNKKVVDKLSETINSNTSTSFSQNNLDTLISHNLWEKINVSISDSALNPNKVVHTLKTLFNQRAWLQVEDINDRNQIREQFGILLSNAYLKLKKKSKAKEVEKIIDYEKKLFDTPIFNSSTTISKSDSSNNF